MFLALFGQLLFEAAFAITVHHGFVPVLAKVFGNVVFMYIIIGQHYNLAKGLQHDTQEGYYGYQFFQTGIIFVNLQCKITGKPD